jgi:serine/threonine-protein kinase
MAPERLTGGRADSATDVYSLGLMLYRALAGELPWPATSASQVLAAHAAGTPTLRVPDGVPDEIVAACQACVAKDPAARPSMAELARVLGGSVDDVPVPIAVPKDLAPTRTVELTLAPTEPHVPVRVRRRHLVLAGVAAAVLLLGLVGAMSQVSTGTPPDPGASFGDAAVPGASPSGPVVLPAQAGQDQQDDDNRGPGNGGDNGNSGHGSGGGNGGSGRRG